MKARIIKLQVPSSYVLMFYGKAKELREWLLEDVQKSDEIDNDSKKKIKVRFEKEYPIVESFENCKGKFSRLSARTRLIHVNKEKTGKTDRLDTAVHEIIHCVDNISDFFGIKDTEYRAYLGGFLNSEFRKMISETKKRDK